MCLHTYDARAIGTGNYLYMLTPMYCDAAWACVDAAVAYMLGLDQSKYQWAVDRYQRQVSEVRKNSLKEYTK